MPDPQNLYWVGKYDNSLLQVGARHNKSFTHSLRCAKARNAGQKPRVLPLEAVAVCAFPTQNAGQANPLSQCMVSIKIINTRAENVTNCAAHGWCCSVYALHFHSSLGLRSCRQSFGECLLAF